MKTVGMIMMVLAITTPTFADQCVGAIVLGQCYGSVIRDVPAYGQPEDNYFRRDGGGYYAAPQPGMYLRPDGSVQSNFSPRVMPDGRLGWIDED